MDALKYFGLKEWFEKSFTSEEKKILLLDPSLDSEPGYGVVCGSQLLAWSLGWYSKKDNSVIVEKVFNKILELYLVDKNKMTSNDLHFFYSNIITNIYKFRDTWAADYIVNLCEQQIQLAPIVINDFSIKPEHVGYNTLIAIEKKNKNWPRVLELSHLAMSQGWAGKFATWAAEAEKKITPVKF